MAGAYHGGLWYEGAMSDDRDANVTTGDGGSTLPAEPGALAAAVESALALLEAVAVNPAPLAVLDDKLRARLMIAAGKLSRPDRYTRKALSKALVRERKR